MIEYTQVNDWCQDDFLQLFEAQDICSESSALKNTKILRLSDHKNGDF